MTPTSPSNLRPNRWLIWNGLLLLSLGVLTLVVALTARAANWWAIFIFAPAAVLFVTAAVAYGRRPRLSDWNVRVNVSLGVIVATVGCIFALGLDWSYAWTFMLIVPGLAFALNSLTRRPAGSAAFGWARFAGAVGLSTALLGVTFLGQQLGFYHLSAIFGDVRWWGAFILFPGLVAIAGALAVFARSTALPAAMALRGLGLALGTTSITRSGSRSSAIVLMVFGAVFCAAAAGQFLALHWAWQAPLLFLSSGTALLASAVLAGD